MREEPLNGGRNAREVVRVGDTVRRAREPGSEAAARLLGHLESAGYPHAPRYLGVDEHGRDILTHIPGQTTDHPSQRADGAYARGAAMLRELHALTAGHPLAAGRECFLHGDPGPFNAIFQDGMPVAFIDWTSCPIPAEVLIGAMIRSQNRILLHSGRATRSARHPAAQRAWAQEAVRWAS